MSEKNNFIYQNKLDSVSALCSKKMALKILRNAFKKWYNYWVSTFLKTLLWIAKCCYGNCLWRVSYKRGRCSQEAAVNLHIGIKNVWPLSHFSMPRFYAFENVPLRSYIFLHVTNNSSAFLAPTVLLKSFLLQCLAYFLSSFSERISPIRRGWDLDRKIITNISWWNC